MRRAHKIQINSSAKWRTYSKYELKPVFRNHFQLVHKKLKEDKWLYTATRWIVDGVSRSLPSVKFFFKAEAHIFIGSSRFQEGDVGMNFAGISSRVSRKEVVDTLRTSCTALLPRSTLPAYCREYATNYLSNAVRGGSTDGRLQRISVLGASSGKPVVWFMSLRRSLSMGEKQQGRQRRRNHLNIRYSSWLTRVTIEWDGEQYDCTALKDDKKKVTGVTASHLLPRSLSSHRLNQSKTKSVAICEAYDELNFALEPLSPLYVVYESYAQPVSELTYFQSASSTKWSFYEEARDRPQVELLTTDCLLPRRYHEQTRSFLSDLCYYQRRK